MKSSVETGGLSLETRLVCTSCAVEFEIKFTDEPVAEVNTTEIALFEAFAETLEEKLGPQPATPGEADACDVLGLASLPAPSPVEAAWEQGLVLEEAGPVVIERRPEPPADGGRLMSAHREDEEVEEVSEARPAHVFEREPARAVQNFDKYNVGVRLMQASPVWLLLAGLSFISFVVLCNWFFVPANLAQADPSRMVARGNQATNLSVGQSVGHAQPAADEADEREDTRPATRPAEPVETKAEQPSPEPAPTSTPAPATPQPAAEVTPAPAESARVKSEELSSAPDGKFTLQVGSYNVAAEAEARASSLKAAGVEARVAQVEIPKRGTWYRVQAGRFASREEAERGGRQLREKGLAASYLTASLQ
ncbi:MAG: SPOR domain-containing protein [Acidobacteria bacterium]|nr:SPOR domain-containing protein [Acidobacteriota bacterium]